MSKRITTSEFIAMAKEVHGDKYDYSQSKYFDAKTPVRIICSKHGMFWATKSNHIGKKSGCSYCSGRKALMQKLTQARIKEVLKYNELTGELTRYVNDRGGNSKIGSHGYEVISVDNKLYLKHRLIFMYMTGKIPEVVDHIDHDKLNNSWSNLRATTLLGNNRNLSGDEMTGIRETESGKYSARLMIDYKEQYLGTFETLGEAQIALNDARKGIFHDNHGTN